MPTVLASTQPGRSTTATVGTGPPGTGCSPVSCSTCATAVAAARCSSSTTAAASSREVSGPGLTRRRAVRPARSQSTRDEGRLIASPYGKDHLSPREVHRPSHLSQARGEPRDGAVRARRGPLRGGGSSHSPAAATGQGVNDDVERRLAGGDRPGGAVGEHGEGQQPAVGGEDGAGQ